MLLTNRPRTALLAFLLPALLAACTGTTEGGVIIRLAVLSGSGDAASLSAVDVGTPGTRLPTSVPGAVDIETLPGGNQIAVLYGDHLELRDANFASTTALPNPAAGGFRPCFVKLEASTARDRLAALSDCGGGALQQVAVWRSDGTLSFSATLGAPTPADPQDTHIAVQGDILWAAHPAVGLGSELLQVTRNIDGTSFLAPAIPTANLYDLAYYNNALYAATDNGVQSLTSSGVLTPLPVGTPGAAQLGTLNSSLYTSDRLLASWYDTGSAPLQLWNGSQVGIPAYFTDLRDVTFAPDATVYTLNAGTLTQYDSTFGLAGNGWRANDLASFNNPRAVTWLIPPP